VGERLILIELADAPPNRLDPVQRDLARELEEELVLGLEVRVEGAARESGAVADGLDGCRVEPHLGEDLRRRVEQPSPRRLAPPGGRPAARDSGVGHAASSRPMFTRSSRFAGRLRTYDTLVYPIQRCIHAC